VVHFFVALFPECRGVPCSSRSVYVFSLTLKNYTRIGSPGKGADFRLLPALNAVRVRVDRLLLFQGLLKRCIRTGSREILRMLWDLHTRRTAHGGEQATPNSHFWRTDQILTVPQPEHGGRLETYGREQLFPDRLKQCKYGQPLHGTVLLCRHPKIQNK
jgi:hypothetical protein